MTPLSYRIDKLLIAALVIFASLLSQLAHAAECLPPPQAPTPEVMQRLVAEARDRGFLWKISKDNHDSWLYGTIHIGKLEWAAPGPTVIGALQSSELVALELDPTDPATIEKLGMLSRQGAGQIPESLRARVKKQLDAVCLPATAIDEQNPLILFSGIEVLVGRREGLEFAYGVEPVLVGYAQAGKKKLVSLETAESQMSSLMGEDGTVSAEDIEFELAQLESGASRKMLAHLAQVWSQGDIADLQRYPSWCQCMDSVKQRQEMKRLLDDRNGPLADTIDALHAQGHSVFVAVGSLHMVGDMGLPALLQRKGYAVSPILFKH